MLSFHGIPAWRTYWRPALRPEASAPKQAGKNWGSGLRRPRVFALHPAMPSVGNTLLAHINTLLAHISTLLAHINTLLAARSLTACGPYKTRQTTFPFPKEDTRFDTAALRRLLLFRPCPDRAIGGRYPSHATAGARNTVSTDGKALVFVKNTTLPSQENIATSSAATEILAAVSSAPSVRRGCGFGHHCTRHPVCHLPSRRGSVIIVIVVTIARAVAAAIAADCSHRPPPRSWTVSPVPAITYLRAAITSSNFSQVSFPGVILANAFHKN